MGLEATCRAVYNGSAFDGTALLESDYLLVRGKSRVKVMLADLTQCLADERQLTLRWSGGCLELTLGPAAAKWAEKIENPKTLIDKLGIRPGMIVAIKAHFEEDFVEQLRQSEVTFADSDSGDIDLLFYEANSSGDLKQLSDLRTRLAPSGAIWAVFLKGKSARLKDTEVIAAARSQGLVDTKVARFSETHTALKLVIPSTQRGIR